MIALQVRLHRETRRFDQAEPLIRRALEHVDGLARVHPDSVSVRDKLARTLVHLGLLLTDSGRPDEAMPVYDRALAINQQLADEAPDSVEWASLTAGNHNNRGLALARLGRHEEALPDFETAIAIERRCVERAPLVRYHRDWLYNAYRNLGKSLRALGRIDASYEAALAGHRLLPGEPASIYNYSCDLAVLSGLLARRGAELTPDERARQRLWAEQSPVELRRSIDAGFHDVRLMAHDSDYDAIRTRADFRDVLTDLIFRFDPFAH